MKILRLISLFWFILLLSSTLLFGQYPWPVPNMYKQHKITGTLGEFRRFGRVLHEGIDISEDIGTPVLAISSATVENIGLQSIEIYDGMYFFRYIHIKPDDDLNKGDAVQLSDTLGKIKKIPGLAIHLHFEFTDGLCNPLQYLQPFEDKSSPEVDKIEVVKEGSGESFPIDPETGLPLVSGYVDIKAWVWDPRVNADGSSGGIGCAPYRIGYAIYDEGGNLVQGLISRIYFPTTFNCNVSWIYSQGSSYDPVNFIYWVTNYRS